VYEGPIGALHVHGGVGIGKYGGTGPRMRFGLEFQPAFLSP